MSGKERQEEQRKYAKTWNLCSIRYIVGNKFSVHAQFTIYQLKTVINKENTSGTTFTKDKYIRIIG